MAIFIFLRHGENDYVKKGRLAGRQPGVHLNETGRAQAEKVAGLLAKAPIKAVYSSPLERAVETAEPLAKALGQPVIIRPGLIEGDVGEWQDRSIKELRRLKAWRTVQVAPSLHQFPGGETFVQAQQRMVQEIESLRKLHDPRDLLVCVSHSDPIKLAVAFYLGMPLDLFQRLSVSPASLTVLQVGETGSNLLTLNYDPHGFFSVDRKTPKKRSRA